MVTSRVTSLLLSKPNASYRGRYYQFTDVTIDPRPSRLPEMWVSGGSRLPDPGEHDVPTLAPTVARRIVRAGNWLSRCSGMRRMGRDPGTLTSGHAKAVEASRAPFLRAMGAHRSWEHLQECYLVGSIDRINARIADLVAAGLEYLVLGGVTDDPGQVDLIAKRVMPAFA